MRLSDYRMIDYAPPHGWTDVRCKVGQYRIRHSPVAHVLAEGNGRAALWLRPYTYRDARRYSHAAQLVLVDNFQHGTGFHLRLTVRRVLAYGDPRQAIPACRDGIWKWIDEGVLTDPIDPVGDAILNWGHK